MFSEKIVGGEVVTVNIQPCWGSEMGVTPCPSSSLCVSPAAGREHNRLRDELSLLVVVVVDIVVIVVIFVIVVVSLIPI